MIDVLARRSRLATVRYLAMYDHYEYLRNGLELLEGIDTVQVNWGSRGTGIFS